MKRSGAALLFATLLSPAAAQDIRGLEVCTAEKQMDRRTSCLQSNVEFLQQALAKVKRETDAKLAIAGRDLAAAKADIAHQKAALTKIESEIARLTQPAKK